MFEDNNREGVMDNISAYCEITIAKNSLYVNVPRENSLLLLVDEIEERQLLH